MDNILITGGAGFIGSHSPSGCCGEGKRLAIVDNLDDYYPAELKRANLEEVERRESFNSSPPIFATVKSFGKYSPPSNPRPSFTWRPGRACACHSRNPRRIPPSTCWEPPRCWKSAVKAACGAIIRFLELGLWTFQPAPFREDATISHPLSIYAATKVAGEALAFTYSHAYALPVVCLRLFTVYGPRQRPDLAIRKFAGMILEGKEMPIFGDGSMERDYTYIDDIVDGILRALDAPGRLRRLQHRKLAPRAH